MPIYKTEEKKDGLFKYRVRVNYTDSKGKARSLTRIAYGITSARQLESKLALELSKTPASTMWLSDLIDTYLNAIQYELRESSVDKSRSILNRHVRPFQIRLDKLSVKTLLPWKEETNQKNISSRMKKNIFKTFRAMLNWAVKMEYIEENPLPKLGNFRDAYEKKTVIQYYTPEEFLRYSAVALSLAEKKGFYDYYVFFNIAYYTGARKGEIHALRWSDIAEDYSTITINKSIAQKLKGGDRETPPKNMASNRTIVLPLPLVEILKAHYKRGTAYTGFNGSYHICGGIRPLRDSSLSNMNALFSQLAGLHRIRIHDFRHSHASVLANNGINIMEISRRLGHSTIDQTLNTYSHLYPREEERATSVLNKICP